MLNRLTHTHTQTRHMEAPLLQLFLPSGFTQLVQGGLVSLHAERSDERKRDKEPTRSRLRGM